MHVYRNRRYEEENSDVNVAKERRTNFERMIETSKQKTHTGTSQDHRKRNTDTHTETNKSLRARDMIKGEIVPGSGAEFTSGQRLFAPNPDDEGGDTIVT